MAQALRVARGRLEDELGAGDPPAPDLSAHGALGDAARRAIRRRALLEVVLPCADALLA